MLKSTPTPNRFIDGRVNERSISAKIAKAQKYEAKTNLGREDMQGLEEQILALRVNLKRICMRLGKAIAQGDEAKAQRLRILRGDTEARISLKAEAYGRLSLRDFKG